MGWQPARLTRDQLAERRLAAARLIRAKRWSQAAIARELGVSRAAVTRWKQRPAREGRRGRRRRAAPGRASSLAAAQWRHPLRLRGGGAQAAGFETARWTQRRIAGVLQREFGVRDHPHSLSRALRARGWRPQRPPPRATERDEAGIAAWPRRDWPRIERGLAAPGAPLPSWTRRVTRFGPAPGPPGRPPATRRS